MPTSAHLQRILLAITQLSLLLPFLVVADCGGSNPVGYTGLQVYDRADELAAFVGLPGLVAVALFSWAWRPGPGMGSTAPGLGLRAMLSGAALFAVLMGPSLAHLFHNVRPQIGWLLQGSAWGLLYLGFLGGALLSVWRREDGPSAPPETWGAVALVILSPLLAAAVTAVLGRNAWAGPLALGGVVGIPLAAAVLGMGRRRLGGSWRALMFGLVAVWMLLCGSAALG